jgi:hypothetical protein
MEIRELPPEHFEKLAPIFDAEFDSDAPLPGTNRIFVAYDDGGEPVGFVRAEQLVWVGQLYVVPERRNTTTSIARSMVNFLKERFAGKCTVAAIASEPRFEKLFESFGFQKIEGTFHRRNANF